MKLRELATQFPTQMLKYPRGTDTLRHATARPRDRNVPATVVVFAGNTGSGKTWRAHTELEARFGPDGYYVCEGRRSAALHTLPDRLVASPILSVLGLGGREDGNRSTNRSL